MRFGETLYGRYKALKKELKAEYTPLHPLIAKTYLFKYIENFTTKN